jgi:hypothetical protein
MFCCPGGNCSRSFKSKTALFVTSPKTAKELDTPPGHAAWSEELPMAVRIKAADKVRVIIEDLRGGGVLQSALLRCSGDLYGAL